MYVYIHMHAYVQMCTYIYTVQILHNVFFIYKYVYMCIRFFVHICKQSYERKLETEDSFKTNPTGTSKPPYILPYTMWLNPYGTMKKKCALVYPLSKSSWVCQPSNYQSRSHTILLEVKCAICIRLDYSTICFKFLP